MFLARIEMAYLLRYSIWSHIGVITFFYGILLFISSEESGDPSKQNLLASILIVIGLLLGGRAMIDYFYKYSIKD